MIHFPIKKEEKCLWRNFLLPNCEVLPFTFPKPPEHHKKENRKKNDHI